MYEYLDRICIFNLGNNFVIFKSTETTSLTMIITNGKLDTNKITGHFLDFI